MNGMDMLNVFSLLVMIHVVVQHVSSQCSWSGFEGCECNILGACDIQRKPVVGLDNMLTGYAPKNVEQFQYIKHGVKNLAYLCEDETVTIMYDCNARIPLYAATMMTAAQLNSPYKREGSFRLSGDHHLHKTFQQADSDYKDSKKRLLCYETSSNYLVDVEWYKSKTNAVLSAPYNCPPASPDQGLKSPMAKGHLIAASYGKGYPSRIKATFTYTNSVPQFESFNSGQWAQGEKSLIEWGQDNCATANRLDARMFIVVGAIPSTYHSSSKRFFGASGFSDFDGWSTHQTTYSLNTGKKEYRVNVPSYMWTAACCTFKYYQGGHLKDGTTSTAFLRSNDPGTAPCWKGTPSAMINIFQTAWPPMTFPPVLFPKNNLC